MKENKHFIDYDLGIILIAFFMLVCLGIGAAWKGLTISMIRNVLQNSAWILTALGVCITMRTGILNLSGFAIGYTLLGILTVLSFSVGAWALVIGMTIVLALLFSLMGKIWRIPVWPFALGIQLILQGMVFMMTDTMPVMMSTGQPSWIVRGFIGFIPVSFLLVVIIAVVVWGMFQVTPWGKPIKQQRQGDEVSFGWACGAQIACIVLGMVEAWLLMKRINVYQPSIFMGFSRPLMAFLMIFFSSCSKRLDNRVMPVIMMVLGAMFLNGFQVNMNLMMLSSFVQQGILLVLAIGSTWMNRVYRMKGWYPMVVLASIGSVMGWIAIPVVIVAMVYQKIKGYGWGDWMPLENTDILPNQVMSS